MLFVFTFYRFFSTLKYYEKEKPQPSLTTRPQNPQTESKKSFTPFYTVDKNKAPNLPEKELPENPLYPSGFDLSYVIWEVHPNFVRIITGGVINSLNEFNVIKTEKLEVYSDKKPYELEFEGNLSGYKLSEERGGERKKLSFYLFPANTVKENTSFEFKVSFKAEDLPQVVKEGGFKRKVIISPETFDIFCSKRVLILGIPSEAKIEGPTGLSFYRQQYQGSWRLYFYELSTSPSSQIKCNFTFTSDAEYLNVEDILKKI